MNTQFAKVGKTYPKTNVIIEDDPWRKSFSFSNEGIKKEMALDFPKSFQLWKKL
ncbi:hypothetical protein [Flavobacterium sp. UMI-01]|uniref:hypothetical protein n=1 Tax=Flavobacterium sp. UMI-01 TaxID=1441053 RepID=UPI001C7CB338|nr:hypothetical protein [Flavobacterium sp. UMI-01]GIZ10138.1 hypothetical protein FUMI01_28640 [Flavobacterium sp. UMI-01]